RCGGFGFSRFLTPLGRPIFFLGTPSASDIATSLRRRGLQRPSPLATCAAPQCAPGCAAGCRRSAWRAPQTASILPADAGAGARRRKTARYALLRPWLVARATVRR